MTKARDLANIGTTLATVSTTELGYLDGVTSAIQTQLDGKSGTSHNHDSTYIAKTLTTTTGDMIYASSANTPARLAIGSSSQVLTVSGGLPVWATSSSGGGMTLLQTMALSGSSTTSSTLSSAYKQFVIYIKGAYIATGNQYLNLRMNSDTGSNYQWSFSLLENASTNYSVSGSDTSCRIGTVDANSTNATIQRGILTIMNPADTDYVYWQYQGWVRNSSGTVSNQWTSSAGGYDNSAAITSITLLPSSSTFSGGNAYIYGVN